MHSISNCPEYKRQLKPNYLLQVSLAFYTIAKHTWKWITVSIPDATAEKFTIQQVIDRSAN